MIITTAKGAKFNTELPAKSNIIMELTATGGQVMQVLRITGNMETVTEFMESVSMIEVDCLDGITQVNEDYIWQ